MVPVRTPNEGDAHAALGQRMSGSIIPKNRGFHNKFLEAGLRLWLIGKCRLKIGNATDNRQIDPRVVGVDG